MSAYIFYCKGLPACHVLGSHYCMDGHAEHWPPDHGLMLRPRGEHSLFLQVHAGREAAVEGRL